MPRTRMLRPPRPPRVFYGWYIVTGALIAQFVAVGITNYVAGVFLKPMAQDLGWSREGYANAQTLGTFVMGGLGLFMGGLIDRRGARPLMIAGALVGGLSLLGLSRVQTLGQFYLLRGIGVTLGSVGMGNLVVNVTVAKWFIRNRGMAVAVASAGVSLAGVLLTPVAQILVDQLGWRNAWVVLGVTTWLIVIPTSFLMRRTPEDHGLRPDGDAAGAAVVRVRRASAGAEEPWTRAEALRTPTIWLIIFAYGIANIGLGAMLFHMLPFLTDSGFSTGTAAFLFSVHAWAALLSKPVWGLLMNSLHARYLSAIAFVASGAAVPVLLAAAGSGSEAATAVMLIVWGFAIGGSIPLQETVWASYFGRQHLGKIRAVAMPFTILFSAMGPKLAARLYDRNGDYVAAFLIFALFWAVGAVLVLIARPPRRRISPVASGRAAGARGGGAIMDMHTHQASVRR